MDLNELLKYSDFTWELKQTLSYDEENDFNEYHMKCVHKEYTGNEEDNVKKVVEFMNKQGECEYYLFRGFESSYGQDSWELNYYTQVYPKEVMMTIYE